jgi:hypothetical protein
MYIPCVVNVYCSMKFSYNFVWTAIALFLTMAVTHAQDCDPNVDPTCDYYDAPGGY